MQNRKTYRVLMLALVLFVLVSASACGQAAPAPATAAPPTAALPSATTAATKAPPPTTAPTLPPSPTATETPVPPTSTPQPSATPTLGIAQEGLSAWCMPENSGYKNKSLTAVQAPETARIGEIVDGALEIKNLPASACAFLYTFNQTAPTGLKLEFYEARQAKPWLVADLLPVEGSPNTLAAVLYHTYIIAPPLWDVSFEFAVRDANGTEIRRDPLNLHRWRPKLCWNGIYPNINTMRCNAPQDLHPWDPSYLTPMPTFAPGEDPRRGW